MLLSLIPAGLEEGGQRKEYCRLTSRLGLSLEFCAPGPNRKRSGNEGVRWAAFDKKTTGLTIFGVPWWTNTSYLTSSCS